MTGLRALEGVRQVLRWLQGALDLEEMLLREEQPPDPERGRE
jgi:hypothetical protein